MIRVDLGGSQGNTPQNARWDQTHCVDPWGARRRVERKERKKNPHEGGNPDYQGSEAGNQRVEGPSPRSLKKRGNFAHGKKKDTAKKEG